MGDHEHPPPAGGQLVYDAAHPAGVAGRHHLSGAEHPGTLTDEGCPAPFAGRVELHRLDGVPPRLRFDLARAADGCHRGVVFLAVCKRPESGFDLGPGGQGPTAGWPVSGWPVSRPAPSRRPVSGWPISGWPVSSRRSRREQEGSPSNVALGQGPRLVRAKLVDTG